MTARELKISKAFAKPTRKCIHLLDLPSGNVRFISDFYDWKLSPDGQYIAGGKEQVEKNKSYYAVLVVSIRGGTPRLLERFPISSPWIASFRWSSDSRRVAVITDRDDDGENEVRAFRVVSAARAHSRRKSATAPTPRLAKSTFNSLRKRFAHVEEITFSPDRKWIAARCWNGDEDIDYQGGLFLFRADGQRLTQVTVNGPYTLISPSQGYANDDYDWEFGWMPNGRQIVFRRGSFEEEL